MEAKIERATLTLLQSPMAAAIKESSSSSFPSSWNMPVTGSKILKAGVLTRKRFREILMAHDVEVCYIRAKLS